MSRLAKMSARHMGNHGFSIGIDDVTPRPPLVVAKAAMMGKGYGECDDYITQFKKVRALGFSYITHPLNGSCSKI